MALTLFVNSGIDRLRKIRFINTNTSQLSGLLKCSGDGQYKFPASCFCILLQGRVSQILEVEEKTKLLCHLWSL